MNRRKKTPLVSMSYADLELAYLWSDGPPGENSAYISKSTGEVFCDSDVNDVVEELPDDIGDPELYWKVPDKRDLGLGSELAYDFIERHAPQQYDEVREIFGRRGAYERFKSLLLRYGLLESWHAWENSRTEAALRDWAESVGIRVVDEEPTADPDGLDDE